MLWRELGVTRDEYDAMTPGDIHRRTTALTLILQAEADAAAHARG